MRKGRLTAVQQADENQLLCVRNQVYGRNGGEFDAAALMGHHFCVIRAVAANSGTQESSEQVQDRLVKDYFDTVEDWDV